MSASFSYDGDGKRVKSTINGTTTYFVGAHYEVSGSTITKYYFAGTQRIAMRTNGTLKFLLEDHLGSTSLTTDASGNLVSEMRYKAWGEVRYASGSTPTKYQYTGQFSNEMDFGLYFYNARWLDVSLGRFAQADTITPGGAQGYDRYAYASNNPLKYADPSGHRPDDGCITQGCNRNEQQNAKEAQALAKLQQAGYDQKCATGNDAYCSTAVTHPVETAAFVVAGLVGGPLVEYAILSGAGSTFYLPTLVNGGIGGAVSTLTYAGISILTGSDITWGGLAGSFTSGAIAGMANTTATPLAGSALHALDLPATGLQLTIGSSLINGAAGLAAYHAGGAVNNIIDVSNGQEPSFTPTGSGNALSVALPAIVSPMASSYFPVKSVRTLNQAAYFIPGRAMNTVLRNNLLYQQTIYSSIAGGLFADALGGGR